MASQYPNLGFDPCPGDLPGYQALAAYAGRSARTLADSVRTLSPAGPRDWRGEAADSFRAHVQEDVLPLARTASDLYKEAGLENAMTKAPTWAGAASKIPIVGSKVPREARTTEVAPGLFRMIGNSLKEAGGGTNATAKELKAIKDFAGYGKWRAVDIVAGQASWSFSAAGIEAIPGNVRDWANNVATGKTPWQESANAAAGLG